MLILFDLAPYFGSEASIAGMEKSAFASISNVPIWRKLIGDWKALA
jgi:hypothetical protein